MECDFLRGAFQCGRKKDIIFQVDVLASVGFQVGEAGEECPVGVAGVGWWLVMQGQFALAAKPDVKGLENPAQIWIFGDDVADCLVGESNC